MASSQGFRDGRSTGSSRPSAALGRSNSDQLLLRKRQDLHYLDGPAVGAAQSARERKALVDAAETALLQHQYQQQHYPFQSHRSQQSQRLEAPPEPRSRTATHVLSRHNDQSMATTAGPFRLNRKEKLFLIKRARESAVALIDHAHTLDGPIQWLYKGKHRGIQMYRGEGVVDTNNNTTGPVSVPVPVPRTTSTPVLGGDAPSLEFLCGVTTMMGTLDEVSEYFDQATTARMKVKKAEDVLDCAVLYSLVWGNTVNPFHRVSVKYHAYEGPAAMTRPRDFCYLECQDTFRHASGRRGWVLSMHSIKIPSCPEVPGFVRGSVYHSGLVFVEAERPGYMDVMYSLQINFKGHGRVPTFLLNAALKRRLRELIHISREIQVARMAHHTLLQDKDLMPKHLRSTCVNCSRRFWLFLRKTRCRVCGEVVCQSCAPLVQYEGANGNTSNAKTRICVKCYSTAPTTGSWTAPSDGMPWTEQSHFEHKTSVPMLSPQRTTKPRHKTNENAQDHEDDDDDNEGRYTFAELEEQSSHSVFAPERFTRSSMASIAPLQIDEIGVDFEDDDGKDDDDGQDAVSDYWHRGTEDSVFHIGSVNSSIVSRDSYFGRPEPAMPAVTSAARHSHRLQQQQQQQLSSVPDDTPILMEEPEENQVSHRNTRASRQSARPETEAKTESLKPSLSEDNRTANAHLQHRHTTSPMGSKSSFEFLDGLLDMPLRNHPAANDPSRPRAQTTIRPTSKLSNNALNPSTLRAHNLRYLHGFEHETPASSHQTFATPTPTPAPAPVPEDMTNREAKSSEASPVVVLDDLLASTSISSSSTFDGLATSTSSVNTNSLFSRPSSLILQQVRKNRSRTIQLQTQSEHIGETFRTTNDIEDKAEDHRRRMRELNEKALAYTGHRVSTLDTARPSLEPDQVDDEVWRSSMLMEEYRNRRKLTIEALRKKALSIQDDNRESSGTDRTVASSPSFVGIQRIGEAAMSRSPSMSGPLSEPRTRGIYGRSSSGTDRQPPPPLPGPGSGPPMLARKTSDGSTASNHSSPQFTTKQLTRKLSDGSMRWPSSSEDLSFKPSLDLRASEAQKLSVPEEVEEDDEDLRLSPESKRSSASEVQEPETEMEVNANNLTNVNANNPPPLPPPRKAHRDFVTPRSLYAEIGLLTQLHSEAAMLEDANEVDRIKDRIQEQYQLIRTLQLK